MTLTVPARGIPVAKVISYTKKYENSCRLIGAECHQSRFNGLSKDFYTYHLTKREKKQYWKNISYALENHIEYSIRKFENLTDAKKRGILFYDPEWPYVRDWIHFNLQLDVVVGVKV